MVFSPHTSLTALNDGAVLYVIYEPEDGMVKIIHANNGQSLMVPDVLAERRVVKPAPSGAISACLSPDARNIILFYHSLNEITMGVDLYGLTLYKESIAPTAQWTHNEQSEILEDCNRGDNTYTERAGGGCD
jgi:hypothetical protein